MTLAGLCVFLCVHVQDSRKARGPRRSERSGVLQTFVGHLPPTAPGASPLWPEASRLQGDSCASSVSTDTTRSFGTCTRAGCPLPQRRPCRGALCPPSGLTSVCDTSKTKIKVNSPPCAEVHSDIPETERDVRGATSTSGPLSPDNNRDPFGAAPPGEGHVRWSRDGVMSLQKPETDSVPQPHEEPALLLPLDLGRPVSKLPAFMKWPKPYEGDS
ncbi:uncharacterized protein LOC114886213 [Monodon monoceros]|uniref:uncharacterized protein LOC114886213 n=1 Tax=Monodon monoceros TaxID=40151 RepID=UPI0010F93993|nr:uncharacterized protein LOC114886213 [Monodon monoceros]